jgi:hypothetical protein
LIVVVLVTRTRPTINVRESYDAAARNDTGGWNIGVSIKDNWERRVT